MISLGVLYRTSQRDAHSFDKVDRTGPSLMTVRLRYAEINRQIRAALKTYQVVEASARARVGFRQTVHAQLPAKAAPVECDGVISECCKVHRPRHDVGLDAERASVRLVEPKVNVRQIASCHRAPGQRRPGCRLSHHPLRIEKIYRRKSRDTIACHRQFALPKRLAATAAILGALPQHAHAPSKVGSDVRTDCLRHTIGAVPMTSAASLIGTLRGRMMSPITARCTANSLTGPSCGSSEKPVTAWSNEACRSRKMRTPVVP